MGHYAEPSIELAHPISRGGTVLASASNTFKLTYDPALRTWTVDTAGDAPESDLTSAAPSSLEAAMGAMELRDTA